VAASVGLILCFDWKIFLICAVIFFGLFFATHYVSLCSLTSYLAALLLMILFGEMGYYGMDRAHTTELYILMACLTALAFYRHRANIVRLLHGNENKIILSKTK
jgi:glycerol-3-phosphate acyltransferase PlsY